jgi:peptide/nickel transport system ATP-binding protein
VFAHPRHPYTRGLLDSVPKLGAASKRDGAGRLSEITGTVPSLVDPIVGCAFAPRCAFATARCRNEYPPLEEKIPGHRAACWESERMVAQAVV